MAFCSNCGAAMGGTFCVNCGKPDGSLESRPAPAPAAAAPPIGAKKRGPLPFILLGCFGIIVLGAIGIIGTTWFVARKAKEAGFDTELMRSKPALAVAKMVTALNPDVEMVSVDEDRGTITVREKSTGKMITVNLDDAKNGRIVFSEQGGGQVELKAQGGQIEARTPEGVTRIGSVGSGPDWLPAYSGMKADSQFSATGGDGKQGTYTFKTDDSVDAVVTFYEREFPKKSFTVKKTASHRAEATQMDLLTATGEGRTVNITIARAGEETVVSASWQ